MNISIEISGDGHEEVERLKAKMEDRSGLHAAIAMGAEEAMKEHLERNYVPKSKRTGFWGKAAASVEATSNDNEVALSVPHRGARLRWLGGTVRAGRTASTKTGGPTRYLSIPLHDSVAEKLPSEAGDLVFIPSRRRGSGGVLVRGRAKRVTRGKNKGGLRYIADPDAPALYALVEKTRHKPDPGVVPEKALAGGAAAAAKLFIEGS